MQTNNWLLNWTLINWILGYHGWNIANNRSVNMFLSTLYLKLFVDNLKLIFVIIIILRQVRPCWVTPLYHQAGFWYFVYKLTESKYKDIISC